MGNSFRMGQNEPGQISYDIFQRDPDYRFIGDSQAEFPCATNRMETIRWGLSWKSVAAPTVVGWSLPFAKEERVILKVKSQKELRPVAESATIELAVVRNGDGGLGKIIHSPDSREQIEGVRMARGTLWPEDRG